MMPGQKKGPNTVRGGKRRAFLTNGVLRGVVGVTDVERKKGVVRPKAS